MYLQTEQTAQALNAADPKRMSARGSSVLAASFFIVAHVPLALLMREFSQVATMHAALVFVIGLSWALFGRKAQQVSYIGAYITGAEVLWRMSDARIPWEFGKYALVVILLAALLRLPRLKLPLNPFLYFLLLLPSIAMTIAYAAPDELRQQVSFNLSGPLALLISAWFFSQLQLATEQLYGLFIALLGPIVGIAAVALFAIVTAADLNFGSEANFLASGGFGPNQVSAVLGLGALLSFWYVIKEKLNWGVKVVMFGVTILLAAQSALTFSRGGLYNAAGAVILAALFLGKDARSRMKIMLSTALIVVVGYCFVGPQLDAFTGGTLLERFQDTSLTGRELIIQADLRIWLENPLWGVGPGQSAALHEMLFRDSAAHTEFSRLLSEHGLLGLAALLLLVAMAVQNLRRAPDARAKAMAASMIGWSFIFMFSVAMRLVVPSFIFALTFAKLFSEEDPAPSKP